MRPKIDKISDLIAADEWRYKTSDGKTVVARIEIGRPQRAHEDFHGDWYCPVFIEGYTSHVVAAMGVGPVDALSNAMMLVTAFSEQIGEFIPRASEVGE